MKLTVKMPWERDLTVNHMRFGKPSPKARGKWKKRRVRKPHVQAWMQLLAWELRGAHIEAMARDFAAGLMLTCSVPTYIVVDFRFPDKRRRDPHNYFKAICDSVASGLGIDDTHIRISTGSVEVVGKKDAGFTITVEDKHD